MDALQKSRQEEQPHLGQSKLIDFLESLHRICKIGIYYPAGHKVLDQAAIIFYKNLLGIAGKNRTVSITLQGETLAVQGCEIVTLSNALHEFKRLFSDIGINTLEIDRTIRLHELLQFTGSLLLERSQLQGMKEFTQSDIANLPPTVRVRQKEFLVDESAALLDGEGENGEEGLSSVFQVLAEQGLDREKITQCKNFFDFLATHFAGKTLKIKGLPPITWRDVRSLLIKVVANINNPADTSDGFFAQNDVNALSTIFQSLEHELNDRKSRETIKFLVSALGGSSSDKNPLPVDGDKLQGIRPADAIPVHSIDALQAFVNDNFVHRKTLEKLNQIDRREELSILLLLLQYPQIPAVEVKIRQNLHDILHTHLQRREVEILVRGIMHLAHCREGRRFYDAMKWLAISLRSASNFSSQQFLARIYKTLSPLSQNLLWPILVNEILAGSANADEKTFIELVILASRLPGREMKERLTELEGLDCFQEKKISDGIFDAKLRIAYPLLAFLLETSLQPQIATKILSSLQENPSDWLIEAVAPLLQPTLPHHLKFLQIYLGVANKKQFSDSFRVAAGTLVVQHLPNLSEEQQCRAWVIKTIQATPHLEVEETRSLLERIKEEKRMVVIPKWPPACRLAAAEALLHLKRKTATENTPDSRR